MDMEIPPFETNFLENLRPDQKEIYDYVHENPNKIVVVQGYAMTGKTYTLRAIAHSWGKPANVIIYKQDLLEDFRGIGNCHTKARFFMDMFGITFKELKALENRYLDELNNSQFILYIVNLIAQANIEKIQGTLLIIDEYTVMAKPLLIVTLALLKHHKIGTVLCGDHFQLLNEKSIIMGNCTSYDIAKVFTDKSFRLLKNEPKSESVKIVDYMRELVSDEWLDSFARSLVAAVFQKRLFGSTRFSHTHLAGSHIELKNLAIDLLQKESPKPILNSYFIGEQECLPPCKFLNFLPLVVGSSYYVDERSEYRKGELVSASTEDNKVVLRLHNEDVIREQNTEDDVIFYPHKKALLGGRSGKIKNFPIYPTTFKTALKSQGRPVIGPLDIVFGTMTYRGMYVAVSRVEDLDQIVKITINDDPIGHLATSVVNFEELTDPVFKITANLLKNKMVNYKYYNLNDCYPSLLSQIEDLLRSFFDSDCEKIRKEKRDQILSAVESWCSPTLLNPPEVEADRTTSPIHEILKYSDCFFHLSCMKKEDREAGVRGLLANPTLFRQENSDKLDKVDGDKNDTVSMDEEDDDTDLTLTVGERVSSPMKRSGQEMEEDDDIDTKKKKMNSPVLPELDQHN